jgi:hypothetical protein
MPERTSLDFVMGFEGNIYIGPAGSTLHTATGVVLFKNIKDPKIKSSYEEVDATMRRHRGDKAYLHGMRDIEVSFTMFNIKDIVETINVDGEVTDTEIKRPADVQLAYDAMFTRNKAVTLFLIDKAGGEGFYGDALLFADEKKEESGEVQQWEVKAKPSAHGTGFHTYNDNN